MRSDSENVKLQLHRVHLASDDHSQNEAEHATAYVGEALADGTPLKIDYFSKHSGFTEEEINKMSLQELELCEQANEEINAWCICDDVVNRIDSEPRPGSSFIQAFVTEILNSFLIPTEMEKKWKENERKASWKHVLFTYGKCDENAP